MEFTKPVLVFRQLDLSSFIKHCKPMLKPLKQTFVYKLFVAPVD